MEHVKSSTENELKQKNLSISIAIVIAGALIAGAVYFSSDKNIIPPIVKNNGANTQPEGTGSLDQMAVISLKDHIRGNQNAPVKIVEYSDFECPFCKRFHGTMQQVMNEYGKSGKVAWVYRHFPLDSIHSKARAEAIAAECAGELGGNDAFWRYTDRFFELTPSNDQTDVKTVLPQIAREIGINVDTFNSCLVSGKYDKHVQEDLDNATATGGNGTPWSIVVAANGKKYPLSGAQSYASVKQLIERALQEK